MPEIDDNGDDRNATSALLRELIALDSRLSALEGSIVFRTLRKTGAIVQSFRRRAGNAILHSPFHAIFRAAGAETHQRNQYVKWLQAHRQSDPFVRRRISAKDAPVKFSIILPTKAPSPDWLRLAVESVIGQTWPNWQLCVGEDGEMPPTVRNWLDELARTDPRVTLAPPDGPSGISLALNRALNVADGEFVVLLDHDDLLEPTALAHTADALSKSNADLLYTDEDIIDSAGQPLRPNFKPGWSPALLSTCMYMGHLIVARRDQVLAAGGFDPACDGSQDFDMVLKLVDRGARVEHIPRVLYHWRSHQGSTAHSPAAKPNASAAGKRALDASLRRRGIAAVVRHGERPNTFHVNISSSARSVSVIIPTRNPALLRKCLQCLHATTLDTEQMELIVLHHEIGTDADAEIRRIASMNKARLVPFQGPFNFALMMNEAVKASSGELLIFLNDDVEPKAPSWLAKLTARLGVADIGITGARLVYPGGAIQHAGIVLNMCDATGHAGRFLFDSSWWPWINNTRDVSAVTGACLATTRRLFEALKGFDPAFPSNYNDVDYCLRARESGFRVVIENEAVLIHHEGLTRTGGTTLEERLSFYRRWGRLTERGDPFFSPHLRKDREDLSLEVARLENSQTFRN